MNWKHSIGIFLFLLAFTSAKAQSKASDTIVLDQVVLRAVVVDGDTIPIVFLREATIAERRKRRSKKYQRRYAKLKRNVIKVYPYAKVAGEIMRQFAEEMEEMKGKKERKDYINEAEEELKKEFEGELRDLTISQGKVLIKLIDRETGETSYELIKELKGSFNAFLWQSLARLFGSNLKDEYDSEGDDRIIEEIVQQIESGQIKVQERAIKSSKVKDKGKRKRRKN